MNDYTKIVLISLIGILFMFVYKYIIKSYCVDLMETTVIKVPNKVKCYFGENKCNLGNVTYWTLLHTLLYFFIGLWAPNHYVFIFIYSIFIELCENEFGTKSKFIIDPIANMIGYAIGSYLANRS